LRHTAVMIPDYIDFTEESNSEDYLEKAVGFIKTTGDNPLDWKWVILAIHGALYGFMICALKGTDPDSNVCDTTKAGHQKLIDFREALKRCQDSSRMNFSGFTKILQLSENQKQAVGRIRNQFLHYRPASWSIELVGLPGIIAHGLDAIGSVALEMGSYHAHYNRERVASLIAEGKNAISVLQGAATA
jgi:hypothetical protein